jgi:transposase
MSNRHTQPMNSTDFRATYAAIVGIDWAEEKHAICLLDGARQVEQELEHTPEAIADWAESLRRQFDGRPVAVCIEQARGALIHALMQYEHLVLFPINPKQAASYRESVSVAGKKDDAFDARLLAFYLRDHPDVVRPWKPDDALTRELGRLCEMRRNIVEFRKQAVQQLTAVLKQYFPQVLDVVDALHDAMALELLHRWPTMKALQRASPVSLRNFFRKFCRRNDEKIDALIAEIRAFKPLTNDFAIIQPSAMFVELLVQQIKQYNVALERFDRKIAEDFAQHEDAAIFRSLPGAGAALAPRLCAAMGTDRNRFESANNVQS